MPDPARIDLQAGNPVRTLPENGSGRDFVVGDLHGCFDLLRRLLDHARFDPGRDRLFSVGDLIDRGPDSCRSLQLLEHPWFHAVRGNHEAMLLDGFAGYLCHGGLSWDGVMDSMFWVNGGAWVLDCRDQRQARMVPEFDRLLRRVLELPVVLTVGSGTARFNVLHSEIVRPKFLLCRYGGADGESPVWLDEDIDRWLDGARVPEKALDRILWGRMLMTRGAQRWLPPRKEGLSTTYCGHTYDTQRPDPPLPCLPRHRGLLFHG